MIADLEKVVTLLVNGASARRAGLAVEIWSLCGCYAGE